MCTSLHPLSLSLSSCNHVPFPFFDKHGSTFFLKEVGGVDGMHQCGELIIGGISIRSEFSNFLLKSTIHVALCYVTLYHIPDQTRPYHVSDPVSGECGSNTISKCWCVDRLLFWMVLSQSFLFPCFPGMHLGCTPHIMRIIYDTCHMMCCTVHVDRLHMLCAIWWSLWYDITQLVDDMLLYANDDSDADVIILTMTMMHHYMLCCTIQWSYTTPYYATVGYTIYIYTICTYVHV